MADSPDDRSGGSATPTIEPFGDAAILITLGSALDPRLPARSQATAAAIDAARIDRPAIGRPVPAQASVLVPFDPLAIALEDVVGVAEEALVAADDYAVHSGEGDGAIASGRDAIEIPVRYGGSDGPDLEAIAELHGLRPADVIDRHASASYRVLFLGFAPGFAYLGGLPAALATPRRDSPRERIPAGSVGIAGEQTGVYPIAMPGGWHLIGRTDMVLFDPSRPDPALLRPGATVRFVPIENR
jgi:KipI family sensor histidine kinase inhibitor